MANLKYAGKYSPDGIQDFEDGAARVVPVTAIGDASLACLIAKTSAPGVSDILTSETGFKMIEAALAGAVAAGSTDAFTEMVAVAVSVAANDYVGVAALLATAVTEFDSSPSSPPVLIPNCRLLRTIDDIVSFFWDGTTTIKTVGVRAVGNTPGQVNVAVTVVE